jgi:hypothetical protein
VACGKSEKMPVITRKKVKNVEDDKTETGQNIKKKNKQTPRREMMKWLKEYEKKMSSWNSWKTSQRNLGGGKAIIVAKKDWLTTWSYHTTITTQLQTD